MRSIYRVTEGKRKRQIMESDKEKRTTRNHDTMLIGIATLWRVSVASVVVVLAATDATNQAARSLVV